MDRAIMEDDFDLTALMAETFPPITSDARKSSITDGNYSEASFSSLLTPSFMCSQPGCSEGFLTKKELQKHKETHRENKHKCPHPGCLMEFSSPNNLTQHIVVHTKAKNYACPRCQVKLGSQTAVKKHFQNRHSDERPFGCRIEGCGKKFKQAGTRNTHEKIHDKNKGKTVQRKRKAVELSESTDVTSPMAKLAKIHELISPEKPVIGPTEPTVFSFKKATKIGVEPTLGNSTLADVTDWWFEKPDFDFIAEVLDIKFPEDTLQPDDFHL